MARRDATGVRMLTRNGHDWAHRFPFIARAVEALRLRSCLIDGEAIAFEDDGVASFELLRHRRHDRLQDRRGEALAISIPRSEAAVIRHFQERMPYGLFVPEMNAN
jgi:ATP-dependent DNA ligase